MEDLINVALDNAMVNLNKRTPLTKKQTKNMRIGDVSPMDIIGFMKSNNIPDDAYFSGIDNGYDSFDAVCLSWEIDIPTTNEDKRNFKRRAFTNIAFKFVYNSLISNGYKRISTGGNSYNVFKDTTAYDMYKSKNYKRLVKYYSLSFSLD